MLRHGTMRGCGLTSWMVCFNDRFCDTRERNVTIRSEIWTMNIRSLGFWDTRECVTLWGLILRGLECSRLHRIHRDQGSHMLGLPRWMRGLDLNGQAAYLVTFTTVLTKSFSKFEQPCPGRAGPGGVMARQHEGGTPLASIWMNMNMNLNFTHVNSFKNLTAGLNTVVTNQLAGWKLSLNCLFKP